MKKRNAVLMFMLILVSFLLDSYVADFVQIIKSPILDSVMSWFSHMITVFFVLIVITSFFLYEEKKTPYIIVLVFSFGIAFLVSYLIKLIVMRPRPMGLSFIDILIFSFAYRFPDYAFPSTHATTAFSVLPVLDKEFKKIKWFWIFIAIMIAISRIYLNEHFLSDVVIGSILGYLIGQILLKFEDKHGVAKKFLQKI